LEFLEELRAAYLRIIDGPLNTRHFDQESDEPSPGDFRTGFYFSIEDNIVLIIAVLHTGRDPAEWQFRVVQ